MKVRVYGSFNGWNTNLTIDIPDEPLPATLAEQAVSYLSPEQARNVLERLGIDDHAAVKQPNEEKQK